MFSNDHIHSNITESVKQLPSFPMKAIQNEIPYVPGAIKTLWRIQNVEGRFIPAKHWQVYAKQYGFTSHKMENVL